MKFTVICKDDSLSNESGLMIKNRLLSEGAIEDKYNPEIVISIGGDGTMLRAVHKYTNQIENVNFVGLHTGTLGFFTNYTKEDIDLLCDNLLHKQPQIDEYSLIDISLNNGMKFLAVNELRVENNYHTQQIDVYLNDQYLQTLKGNGICLSSAIGSTGYNRSLHGPIIHPSLDVMIMNEIAAIQHRYYSTLSSPLVMGKDTIFKMVIKEEEHILLGIDHEIFENLDYSEITCKLSDKKLKMLNYNEFSYVQRLRKAFLEKD